MFSLEIFHCNDDHTRARRPRACRPFVEDFESRKLLSALAPVQGGDVGTPIANTYTVRFYEYN